MKFCGSLSLLLSAVALAVPIHAANAGSDLTASEVLFSSYARPENIDALPPEIILPASWTDRMKEMAKITEGSKKETAACLTWTASATDNRATLIEDYRKLVAKRASLATEKYRTAERQIRARIGDAGASSLTGKGRWLAGNVQNGQANHVSVELTGVQCDGEPIAVAHTHPVLTSAPSDGDIAHVLWERTLRASFSVFRNDVCGLVKTGAASKEDRYDARGLSAAVNIFWHLEALRRGEETTLEYQARQSFPAQAAVAEALGLGLYCGRIGEPLKKVTPMKWDGDNPVYIVLAKAAIVSLTYVYPDKVEAVDFPFTLEVDNAFSSYIQRADWIAGGEAEEILGAKSAGELYRSLLAKIAKSGVPMVTAGELVIPDTRYEVSGPHYASGCTSVNDTPSCSVVEVTGEGKNEVLRMVANYDLKTKVGYVVNKVADKYRVRRTLNGKTKVGPCRYKGVVCVDSGN